MLQDFLTQNRSEFRAGLHTEVRAQESTGRGVSLLAGNLVSNDRSNVSGVSARVFKNGVYGLSASAEYSDRSVKDVIRTAAENADVMDRKVGTGKSIILPALSNDRIFIAKDVTDVEQKRYIEFAKEIDNYIVKKYPDLSSRYVGVRCDSMEKLICTSDGADAHFISPRSYVYVQLSAEGPDGGPVDLFTPFGGSGTFDMNFDDPARLFSAVDDLYEKLMQKKEGIHPEAGLKTVVLGGLLAGMLSHEAVGHTVEADMVLGGSVSAKLLNERVASDLVTLVDFAHTAFGKPAPLPVYADDEGTVAKDQLLIDKGILVGYMNSRETALHFGMEPCGNARAYAFSDEPLIRMRNTCILPGKDKLEDMIASVDDGYYFINTNNGQADTTGEFMFGVTMGYEIKGGKLGRALLDSTITGVAFDMLKTVDMVSDRITWVSSGMCGKKQPMPVGMGGPEIRCKVMVGGR